MVVDSSVFAEPKLSAQYLPPNVWAALDVRQRKGNRKKGAKRRCSSNAVTIGVFLTLYSKFVGAGFPHSFAPYVQNG
jgi:hypothetical protein